MTRVAEVLGLLKPNDVIHGWRGGDCSSCIALLAGHETHGPRRVNNSKLVWNTKLSFGYKTAPRWTDKCCVSTGCQQIVKFDTWIRTIGTSKLYNHLQFCILHNVFGRLHLIIFYQLIWSIFYTNKQVSSKKTFLNLALILVSVLLLLFLMLS